MPRIIAGSAKGRRFRVPKSGTRPTSDKVREALFARLENRGYVKDAVVLDLFTGSGGLALEAKSRGARLVTGVDIGREAAAVARSNARDTGLEIDVVQQKAESFVAAQAPGTYDLILCDPPYDIDDKALAAVIAGAAPLLVEDGLLVVERDKRSAEPLWPPSLALDNHRTWGDTTVWSATPVSETFSVDL